MPAFNVNVRAIVTASSLPNFAASGPSKASPWEVYVHSTRKGDEAGDPDVHVIRCDTSVRVEAEDQESAIEAAKGDAPLIELEEFLIDGCDLWVDEGIDVELDQDEGATPELWIPSP